MIKLSRHIEILLLSHDCVIVPGLGGFMAHHVEARYDERDHSFLPPLRTLGFNPLLTAVNDSLLAQSFVEAYDISYPEAIRRIETEVHNIKHRLETEGTCELNDIGLLHINADGKTEFQPCEAGILSPSLYGLGAFEIKRLTPQPVEASPAIAKKAKTAFTTKTANKTSHPHIAQRQETSQIVSVEESTQQQTELKEDGTGSIRIKISWLRNAAAVAAAIITYLFLAVPVKNSDTNIEMGQSPSQVMFDIMSSAQVKQPELFTPSQLGPKLYNKGIKAQSDTNKIESDSLAPKKQQIATVSQKVIKDYCIVLASKVTKRNAEAFVNELKAKGIDSADIYIHNKIVRVVYGAYHTEREAREALQSLRDNTVFEQSWVYKKK